MNNPIVSEIQDFGRFTLVVGVILFLLGRIGLNQAFSRCRCTSID